MKDLEYKLKNATALREKELKDAEKRVSTCKKKMEDSAAKSKDHIQVNIIYFLNSYFLLSPISINPDNPLELFKKKKRKLIISKIETYDFFLYLILKSLDPIFQVFTILLSAWLTSEPK